MLHTVSSFIVGRLLPASEYLRYASGQIELRSLCPNLCRRPGCWSSLSIPHSVGERPAVKPFADFADELALRRPNPMQGGRRRVRQALRTVRSA